MVPPKINISLEGLQKVAVECGLPKLPPKLALVNRIQVAAKEHKPLPPDVRILSIDLGIKNMAFCILSPQEKKSPPEITTFCALEAASGVKKKPPPGKGAFRYPSADIWAWQRLSLLPPRGTDDNLDGCLTDVFKEDFTPMGMARMALGFVQEYVLPHKPTHVLIERQRSRSGSSAAIFEWTYRVNIMESMIYAILGVYQSMGSWTGEVMPVAPRRVATFLLQDNLPTATMIEEAAKQGRDWKLPFPHKIMEGGKQSKISLLCEMISSARPGGGSTGEAMLHFKTPETRTLAAAFVKSQMAKTGLSREERQEDLAKVDDLADCLLQGLAWIEWNKNLEQLIKNKAWVAELIPGAESGEQAEDIPDDNNHSELQRREIDLEDDTTLEKADLMRKIKRERVLAEVDKKDQIRAKKAEFDRTQGDLEEVRKLLHSKGKLVRRDGVWREPEPNKAVYKRPKRPKGQEKMSVKMIQSEIDAIKVALGSKGRANKGEAKEVKKEANKEAKKEAKETKGGKAKKETRGGKKELRAQLAAEHGQ